MNIVSSVQQIKEDKNKWESGDGKKRICKGKRPATKTKRELSKGELIGNRTWKRKKTDMGKKQAIEARSKKPRR